MKITIEENAVILTPETPFEEQAVSLVHTRGIVGTQFEDAWNRKGGLIIMLRSLDWN